MATKIIKTTTVGHENNKYQKERTSLNACVRGCLEGERLCGFIILVANCLVAIWSWPSVGMCILPRPQICVILAYSFTDYCCSSHQLVLQA
jgi:hypothetical protein